LRVEARGFVGRGGLMKKRSTGGMPHGYRLRSVPSWASIANECAAYVQDSGIFVRLH